jgi:hypothetical protein
LDYLNALASNPKVDWEKVALAHDQWSYDQAGLTGAGAALLTIVVTYFTAGIGTAAVGGTAATATTAATVMGSTALATAVNVGFSSLASQAAVAMVNNKGDLGKTLEQLGSEQSVQNLLTSMITAGALDKLNASYFNGVNATSTFGTQLLKNVTNNLASDLMNSALTGKPFDEKTLANSLQGALINTGMAQGANAIGDAASAHLDANKNIIPAQIDAFTQKVAHALLGCVGGAAIAGNSSGCAPGAVGAVVGELTAEFAKNHKMSNTDALALAKVMSAVSGVVVGGGGDNAAAVNIAASTGSNAAENNFLKHDQAKAMQEEFAACKAKGPSCDDMAIAQKYRKLSDDNISAVQKCVLAGDVTCVTKAKEDAATVSEVSVRGAGGLSAILEERALLAAQGNVTTVKNGLIDDVTAAQQMAVVRSNACVGLSASSCDTKILDLKGQAQKLALTMVGGTLLGAPAAMLLIDSAPALAAAAKLSVAACSANLPLCAVQAGNAVGDIVGAEALGGAALSPVLVATLGSKTLAAFEQIVSDVKAVEKAAASATGQVAKPQTYSKIEDLFGQTFDAIPLSHTLGKQDGVLGEQLAIQLLNEKTGLSFKPLQNASNHGCDGCAISIQGDKITVLVMDAKSSQNGVDAAASASGDPAARLQGWLNQDWAKSPENKPLADALQAALSKDATVQGITVKVGVPTPGTTGTGTFKVEPWTK